MRTGNKGCGLDEDCEILLKVLKLKKKMILGRVCEALSIVAFPFENWGGSYDCNQKERQK